MNVSCSTYGRNIVLGLGAQCFEKKVLYLNALVGFKRIIKFFSLKSFHVIGANEFYTKQKALLHEWPLSR